METKSPRVSKDGDVTLKIYCGANHMGGVSCDQVTLVYFEGRIGRK